MSNIPMSIEDKKWRARSDAETLAEANVIAKDPDRMSMALAEAEKLAEEQRERANAMGAVARKKNPTKSTGKKAGSAHVSKNEHNVFTRI